MSKKENRKSIPVVLEKAQESQASPGEIRPKMQLNVAPDVVSGIKTKQQLEEEQHQVLEKKRAERRKKEFEQKCYYYGGAALGVAIGYLTYRYFFKSNPPVDNLVIDVINGSR